MSYLHFLGGDRRIAELLVQNGANDAGNFGEEALIWAAQSGEILFLAARITKRECEHLHNFFIQYFLGYRKFVQVLIGKGVNLNARDLGNNTALIHATTQGEILNRLIRSITAYRTF